jgi:hypothetical protein
METSGLAALIKALKVRPEGFFQLVNISITPQKERG